MYRTARLAVIAIALLLVGVAGVSLYFLLSSS